MTAAGGPRDPLPAIVAFGESDPRVRALILNGSRARPGATLDAFSDTDVALVVEDVGAFRADLQWHLRFGQQLVGFPNDGTFLGHSVHNRLVLYADGVKVDFLCWPSAVMPLIAREDRLPPVIDQGYQVLLDKDGLCRDLGPASMHPFAVVRPTEFEFLDLVNEFWWETTYVAKSLARDDILHASYNLDVVMKIRVLRRFLEWRIAAARTWRHDSTLLGRGLKEHLDTATWSEFEASYAGVSWATLWRTCDLFAKVARELAAELGIAYPDDLEAGVRGYLRGVEAAGTGPSSR